MNGRRYAGFWVRVLATLIDGILLSLIELPLLLLVYGTDYWQSSAIILGPADFLISWVLPAAVVIWFWQWKSATPGKMLFSATIVDAETGEKPTMRQWLLRYLGYFVAALPVGLGFFWVAFDARKQGWHDKIARTVVVRPSLQDAADVPH